MLYKKEIFSATNQKIKAKPPALVF